MKMARSWFQDVIEILLTTGAQKATKYVATDWVIKATRRCYQHRRLTNNILITFGMPNYLERKFIKQLQKAKEPFPVKKIQLKFLKEKT